MTDPLATSESEPDPLDSLEPHPSSSETNRGHFKQLKEAAKGFRERAKTLEKLTPILSEFGLQLPETPAEIEQTIETLGAKVREAKTAAIPPEVSQEPESYRILTRHSTVQKSLTFDRDFVKPIHNAFVDVIGDIADSIPGVPQDQMLGWAREMIEKHSPEEISGAWLRDQLRSVPDSIAKTRVEGKVAAMSSLIRNKEQVNRELVADGNLFQQWQRVEQDMQKQYDQQYQRDYEGLVRDEVGKLMKSDYKELADLERRAREDKDPAAQEKFQKLENRFKEILVSVNRGGPRAQSKVALENVALKEQVSELKRLKAENERLKKGFGIRERVREVPMRGGNGSGKIDLPKPRIGGKPNWNDLPGG